MQNQRFVNQVPAFLEPRTKTYREGQLTREACTCAQFQLVSVLLLKDLLRKGGYHCSTPLNFPFRRSCTTSRPFECQHQIEQRCQPKVRIWLPLDEGLLAL